MKPCNVPAGVELQFDSPILDKTNSLYLTIRQEPFDEIIAGTKKVEYREVKATTYKNYIKCDEEGLPYFHTDTQFPEEEGLDIYLYNEGSCPFVIKDNINFLRFKAGATVADMDSAVVEVLSIKAVPHDRFELVDGKVVPNPQGRFCTWVMELNLGEVRGLHRKA